MINIKERILQASSDNRKFCLMMVDFNKFDTDKYFAGDKEYVFYEVMGFSTTNKQQDNNLSIKVNKDELLDVCNLFVSEFMRGKKVSFTCMKRHRYSRTMAPYKKCKKLDMTLMEFSEYAFGMMDWSQMQHFQFSLSTKGYGLYGFVHGYQALSEFVENLALNLSDSKVKLKVRQ